MSKFRKAVQLVEYLGQYLQEDGDFLFRLAQHAYLLHKGWNPKWELPFNHPKRWRGGEGPYDTGHAINSQQYYMRCGSL